jgi:tetratricopeptide (TPR) repeat protein
LLKKRNWFLEKYDTAQVDMRINALLNFGLNTLIKSKSQELISTSAPFLNNTTETYILRNTDDEILLYLKGSKHDTINKICALKAFYYLEIGDTANYLICEQEFLELSKKNPQGLFFLANYYYRNYGNNLRIKSTEILKEAYTLDSTDYDIVGLLAQALYDCADYKQALVLIEKAIKLYTENQISPGHFISLRDDVLKRQNNN